MIDFDEARRIMVEEWLPDYGSRRGVELMLDETQTKEYEWGWTFRWIPVDPAALPEGQKRESNPVLVDRVTGATQGQGRTWALKHAVFVLMRVRTSRLKSNESESDEENVDFH